VSGNINRKKPIDESRTVRGWREKGNGGTDGTNAASSVDVERLGIGVVLGKVKEREDGGGEGLRAEESEGLGSGRNGDLKSEESSRGRRLLQLHRVESGLQFLESFLQCQRRR